jgi:translocation and assembly module TamA
MLKFFTFFFLASVSLFAYEADYRVSFLGLEDREALKALRKTSDLVKLQDRPPASVNALRFRVESDIPKMIQLLHAYAYYDASISWEIEEKNQVLVVYLFIHPGPKYLLATYDILSKDCDKPLPVDTCDTITLENLGVNIGAPAYADQIIQSEKNLLELFSNCGYPLATIQNKEITADALEKTLNVKICVDSGPLCHFGPVTLIGLKDVERRYITRKIMWQEGDIYRSDLVDITQKRLIETDLFASVLITHGNKVDKEGQLPMKMRFSETKHRTIAIGGSYATLDGFGGSLTWTNRNFRKMGELLSADIWIAKVNSQGILTWSIPDFFKMDQNYVWQAQAVRENITVYLAQTYGLVNKIERKPNKRNYLSLGLKGEYISVNNSIRNGKFTLLGLPFFWKYTHVENILDPTFGYNLSYKSTAYQAISHKKVSYYKQTFWHSWYVPVLENRRIVFAFRIQLGSIFGAPLGKIPLSKLFFGGSEDDLRGYRFKTVSPLNRDGNPVGGRGSLYWTTEFRFRVTKSIGIVTFSDWGNVTRRPYPDVNGKWYKSVGAGLRYFTFFGPLRLDVGVPLNKRKGLDPNYRIYISVGQSF